LPPKPILAGVGETDGGEDLFVVQVLDSVVPSSLEVWLTLRGPVEGPWQAGSWIRASGPGGQTTYWKGRLVLTNGKNLWQFSDPWFIEGERLLQATDRRRRACSKPDDLVQEALNGALSLAQLLRDVERAGPSAMRHLREGAMGQGARTNVGRRSPIVRSVVEKLEASGLTDALIAAEISVSRETLVRWRKRHGIPRSRQPDRVVRA
jgi:hypothetical protein